MPGDLEPNGGEVSDVMSENDLEYDESDLHIKDDEDDKMTETKIKSENGGGDGSGETKKKFDPKDPHRPRRKKARRACYACQRAHLTCGDERPCLRCIKRGLQDQCQDGVRKKAKYLHDAPAEALRPVLGPNYNANAAESRPNAQRHPSSAGSDISSNMNNFFSPANTTSGFPAFTSGSLPETMSFSSQTSPVSPSFQTPGGPQLANITLPQASGDVSSFSGGALFDPSNPAVYNFNIEGLNFGSTYAALEFGMLNQMSSGAAETPPRDSSTSQTGNSGLPYGSASSFGNGVGQQLYDSGMLPSDILGMDHHSNGLYTQGNLQHGLPHAYAIAAGPQSLQSPSTDNNSPQPTSIAFEGSPTATGFSTSGAQTAVPSLRSKAKPTAKLGLHSLLSKRRQDPSAVYDTVKEPFSYVNGFHKLLEIVAKRFSPAQMHKIAQALASVRPSFITCTRTLDRQDLIFMEKSFQRSLFEYEEFMLQSSSPAIICRRTGEVAAVNKEFTALTGWTKELLLGQEPNLNANSGFTSGAATGDNSGRAGLTTPRMPTLLADASKASEGKPQPIFVAELMDPDSVVDFYEDFSHLAFGDSRGHTTRTCRLLKYRRRDILDTSSTPGLSGESPRKAAHSSILSHRVARIDGEHGISKLEKDGKIECTYCWSIKRDMFDIPMMIVMNFLPRWAANQEVQQMAV